MFPNRIQAFVVPGMNLQYGSLSAARIADLQQTTLPQQVHVVDIYEAARKRAVEEHELDKLFNPDFYDYEI